jgi:hypothetical protein
LLWHWWLQKDCPPATVLKALPHQAQFVSIMGNPPAFVACSIIQTRRQNFAAPNGQGTRTPHSEGHNRKPCDAGMAATHLWEASPESGILQQKIHKKGKRHGQRVRRL